MNEKYVSIMRIYIKLKKEIGIVFECNFWDFNIGNFIIRYF